MIERVLTGRANLLQEFIPCPAELLESVANFETNHAMVAKYGYSSWYDWNIAHWGTKWDFALDCVENPDANTVTASFDSAWSPPIGAYEKLMEMGFEIEAFYYEPGMCFVGKWDNGVDECYEYGSATSDTVRDMIGEELDDYFAISENMAEWETENADD
jgi:hypothetical protein